MSDEELIAKFIKGDRASLDLLVRRYLRPIHCFVRRFTKSAPDAEDVTQEIFVKLWKNAEKFKRGKKFKTWLFSIAKNASLDFLKKKKTASLSQFENAIRDPSPLPDEIFKNAEIADKLNCILKKLAPKHRTVVALRYRNHFTFRRIAEILGEPLDTVKSRHLRALKTLKELLKNECTKTQASFV